jgi:acyl-CoA thioester hydrolase
MDLYAKTFTVRWADCDVNGHMRNTSYSEYAIDTRMAYLAEHGFPFTKFVESGIGPILLHESIDYLREVPLGGTLEVDLSITGLSQDLSRFKFEHDIWLLPERKKAARIVLYGGWMDLGLRKLRVPPEDLQRLLRATPRSEPFEELKSLRSQP